MIKTHKASIKKRKETPNKYGSEVVSYEDFGNIRGFMDYLTVDNNQVAQKFIQDSTHIFICETKLDITQGDRFFVNSIEYEVNFVDRPQFGKLAQIELKETLHQKGKVESFIYFGTSEIKHLIESDLLTFTKEKMDKRSFQREFPTEEGNLFIAYPKTFGKASIRLNHKPITNWEINELMVEGTVYYIYKTEVNDGKTFIELF